MSSVLLLVWMLAPVPVGAEKSGPRGSSPASTGVVKPPVMTPAPAEPAAEAEQVPAKKVVPRANVPRSGRRIQLPPWNLADRTTWPLIASVSPASCVGIGAVLTVKGERFGERSDSGPSLQLTVGPPTKGAAGASVQRVTAWTDTEVAFPLPHVAGVEPGARATVAFSLQGRVLAATDVQVCDGGRKGLSLAAGSGKSTSAAPAAAKTRMTQLQPLSPGTGAGKVAPAAAKPNVLKIHPPEPGIGGVAPAGTGRALRSPVATVRRAQRGGVYLVKVDPAAMGRISLGRRKIPRRTARNFEIPQMPDAAPSEDEPLIEVESGDIDYHPDAAQPIPDCPEGDPNCPDIGKPGDGVTDPPEWHVDLGPGCPPGTMGCDVVIVKIWPDGDPMPGGDPKDVDCTKVKLPGTKFCGFVVDPRKPDILGDPVGQEAPETMDFSAEADKDGDDTCDGKDTQAGHFGACEDLTTKCTGDFEGSRCVSMDTSVPCNKDPLGNCDIIVYNATFQGNDENLDPDTKKKWAENAAQEKTNRGREYKCTATTSDPSMNSWVVTCE